MQVKADLKKLEEELTSARSEVEAAVKEKHEKVGVVESQEAIRLPWRTED